ncbi:RodZ domain-containing protein [Nodularia harveyana UHCC-0300]|uniref:RodZ domain-containing protein n=1 Tax=Nodularia harveyana UHCC-0300 TaxID=2974287 RepID=A0ABU5UJA7_9CYAN|nr:RodZ domain-containing protein [Nodularia harveyana]MEA5582526.1 RodZ domain-containing protein [Nodularia harveyana UHCC-0300]
MKWLKSKDKEQPKLPLKQQQEKKLAELGDRLCASRQEKALSLEEMVALTKIPLRLLEAIEQGNLDDLPEPVYLQGLIRQFADALGFNGVEFASSFPLGGHKRVSSPPTKKKKSKSLQLPFQRYSIAFIRPTHLYLLYISIIVCSVSSLSNILNNNAVNYSNQQPGTEKVFNTSPNQLKSQISANLNGISSTGNPTNKSESVHIGVTLKASSWIRVVADGQIQFEGVLAKGTQRSWKAQEELTVKTDNGGSVLMSINQQAAQEMGEPGKQKEIKIGTRPIN